MIPNYRDDYEPTNNPMAFDDGEESPDLGCPVPPDHMFTWGHDDSSGSHWIACRGKNSEPPPSD